MANWGTFQNPGGCNCLSSGNALTLYGCSGLLFPSGYVIDVYNHSGGTLLYTLTTNSSGVIFLPTGTYYIIPADDRFNGANITITGTQSYTFATASTNYICMACCAIPLARTMTFTSAFFGPWTGNWVTSITTGWTAIVAHCPLCTLYPTVIAPPGFVSSGFPCNISVGFTKLLANNCPCPVGTPLSGTCQFIYYFTTNMTCPPSFSWSGSTSVASANGCLQCIIGNVPPTWTDTLTVTEDDLHRRHAAFRLSQPDAIDFGNLVQSDLFDPIESDAARAARLIAESLIPLPEVIALNRLVNACLFRSRDAGCGCTGARCGLQSAIVSHRDCLECARAYG